MDTTYSELRAEIGRYLGYGRDPSAWAVGSNEHYDVESSLKSGLRMFYYPEPLPGETKSHEWSFLSPLHTLTMVVGQADYDLPADFAYIKGPVTYTPGDNTLYPPIEIIGEEMVRVRRQVSDAAGRPAGAAIVPRTTDGSTGTRYKIAFDREADSAYSLQFRYSVSPEALSPDNERPLGGAPHAETIKEACLAAAERDIADQGTMHYQHFLARLRASILHDRHNAPDNLGRHYDPSDYVPGMYFDRHTDAGRVVTYNGVEW